MGLFYEYVTWNVAVIYSAVNMYTLKANTNTVYKNQRLYSPCHSIFETPAGAIDAVELLVSFRAPAQIVTVVSVGASWKKYSKNTARWHVVNYSFSSIYNRYINLPSSMQVVNLSTTYTRSPARTCSNGGHTRCGRRWLHRPCQHSRSLRRISQPAHTL